MSRIPRLLLVPAASLLLIAPAGAAHAAKANPWSAYFPAKGVTCMSVATDPEDGTTHKSATTVVAKSAKKMVIRETGVGHVAELLLPRGKRRETTTAPEHLAGLRGRLTAIEDYPSPAAVLAHGSATGRFTMTMSGSRRFVKAALTSGRSLTVTATVHATGVGARTVTLGDPAATTVQAIGVRTVLRSFRVSNNANPKFARVYKRLMGSLFGSMNDVEWFARGRGPVLEQTTFGDTTVVETQTGCSRG